MNLDQVLAARLAAGMTDDALRWPRGLVSGRWMTEQGSVLDVSVDGDRLVGTYMSAIGDGTSPLSGPVSGFVRGDIVGFSALLPAHLGTIASWVGQVIDADGMPALKTLWCLIVSVPDADEVTGLWTTVHKGADTFCQATQSRTPKERLTSDCQDRGVSCNEVRGALWPVIPASGVDAQVVGHA